MKILNIIKANRRALRSIILTTIALPIVVGLVYSKPYFEQIPFGILDEDGSALSRTIVNQLQATDTLDVCYTAQSEDDLKNAIQTKKISAGVIIPQHFSRDVSLKKSPKAAILTDGTNMLLGSNALSAAATVLSTVSTGAQIKLLEGSNLSPAATETATLGTFSVTERTLYEPQGSYKRRLLYTIVPLGMMQWYLLIFFAPLLLRRREDYIRSTSRRETRGITAEILQHVAVVGSISVIVSFLSLCILCRLMDLPLRGDIVLYFVSMSAMMLNISAFGMLCVVLARKITNLSYLQQVVTMITLVHIFMSGIIYPIYLMPKPLQVLDRALFPLTNLATELKALNLKGIGWDAALPDLARSMLYTILWLSVGIAVYVWNIHRERQAQAGAQNDTTVDSCLPHAE